MGFRLLLVRGTESPLFPSLPHGLQFCDDESGLFGLLLLVWTYPIPPPACFPAGEERLAAAVLAYLDHLTTPGSMRHWRILLLDYMHITYPCSAQRIPASLLNVGLFHEDKGGRPYSRLLLKCRWYLFILCPERNELSVLSLSMKCNWWVHRNPHLVTEKSLSGEVLQGRISNGGEEGCASLRQCQGRVTESSVITWRRRFKWDGFLTPLLYVFNRFPMPKELRQTKTHRRVPVNVDIRSDFLL